MRASVDGRREVYAADGANYPHRLRAATGGLESLRQCDKALRKYLALALFKIQFAFCLKVTWTGNEHIYFQDVYANLSESQIWVDRRHHNR